ncbi:MAG: hypothetical protein L3J59_04555 [Methylococcaceae bacterium]|nr:hypothetical protein [Methylococcaceae bacterium]
MKNKIVASLIIASTMPGAFADCNYGDMQAIVNFLTANVDKGSGVSYVATAGALKGKILPLSYYNTARYWGEYVCQIKGNKCDVIDQYNAENHTLMPVKNSLSGDLQIERVNINSGSDIYDGATWQLALSVAAIHGLTGPNSQSLFDIANNQNQLLQLGYDGDAVNAPITGANRAVTTADGIFKYNGQSITKPENAFYFRMIARDWLSHDPFINTGYAKYITVNNLPADNPLYQKGKITWADWKPITGENAWAFLIGPLQSAYLQNRQADEKGVVPFDSTPIQNAVNILYAFSRMQSEIGAVYYAVEGSLSNTGTQPVDPYDISTENNASLLAGLLILKKILTQQENPQTRPYLKLIDVMINGGVMPNRKTTEGLLNFFKKYAWDAKSYNFYQGGLANKPGKGAWIPTILPRPVDVNTWAVAVLGQPLIDSWYGYGTAFKIWNKMKVWGGFYDKNGDLWGVGYSNQDGNALKRRKGKGIMSAEWTAGAINMLKNLITQYTLLESIHPYVKKYVASLKVDLQSMETHINVLRVANYSKISMFNSVRPKNYDSLVSLDKNQQAYLYASKRYFIPFGWYANPLPSNTSTSWVLLMNYNYNPFTLGGGRMPNFMPKPK